MFQWIKKPKLLNAKLSLRWSISDMSFKSFKPSYWQYSFDSFLIFRVNHFFCNLWIWRLVRYSKILFFTAGPRGCLWDNSLQLKLRGLNKPLKQNFSFQIGNNKNISFWTRRLSIFRWTNCLTLVNLFCRFFARHFVTIFGSKIEKVFEKNHSMLKWSGNREKEKENYDRERERKWVWETFPRWTKCEID